MKKFLAILMAIFMLVSLCACDKSEGGKGSVTASAYDVMDGDLGKYEVTIDGNKAVLVRSDVYNDYELRCVFSTTLTLYLEKNGDTYTLTKVKRKQTINGDGANGYYNSLDTDEDSLILQMLSENGLVYTEEMMAQSGMKGATASFSFDNAKRLTDLTIIDLSSKMTCKFSYDSKGNQISCRTEYKQSDGDAWVENYVFKELYANGQPKTVECQTEDETETYIYNDQGYIE